MSNSEADNAWHLDKRINVGHLATTAILVAGIFMWGAELEKKVEVNAQAQIFLKEQQSQDRERFESRLSEIKDDLKGLGNKLDRILEKLR